MSECAQSTPIDLEKGSDLILTKVKLHAAAYELLAEMVDGFRAGMLDAL